MNQDQIQARIAEAIALLTEFERHYSGDGVARARAILESLTTAAYGRHPATVEEVREVEAERNDQELRAIRAEARIEKALAVCDAGEHQATRWEQPFPVPAWVTDVRAALASTEEQQ